MCKFRTFAQSTLHHTTVAHNCHIKYKLLTSNTKSRQQIQITHIKNKLLTSNTNYSHQIQNPDIKHKLLTSNTQIAHIKYKSLRSKTRLNGQRSENENYVQFSTSFPGLFPLKLGGAGKDPGIGWSRDPS